MWEDHRRPPGVFIDREFVGLGRGGACRHEGSITGVRHAMDVGCWRWVMGDGLIHRVQVLRGRRWEYCIFVIIVVVNLIS